MRMLYRTYVQYRSMVEKKALSKHLFEFPSQLPPLHILDQQKRDKNEATPLNSSVRVDRKSTG